MYKAIKNGKTAILSNEVQVAAYEKSGWTIEKHEDNPFQQHPETMTRIDFLKAEADKRGITYHWNSGAEKLESLIEDFDRSHAAQQ